MSATNTTLRVGASASRLVSFHSNKLPSLPSFLKSVLTMHGGASRAHARFGCRVLAAAAGPRSHPRLARGVVDRISSFLLARVHPVSKRTAGFKVKVMGKIPNGYKLLARQENELQEVRLFPFWAPFVSRGRRRRRPRCLR